MQSDGRDVACWEFILQDGVWIWRTREPGGASSECSELFVQLGHALHSAARCGFDRERDYWLVRTDGRVTHFRPGQPGVNMPADLE